MKLKLPIVSLNQAYALKEIGYPQTQTDEFGYLYPCFCYFSGSYSYYDDYRERRLDWREENEFHMPSDWVGNDVKFYGNSVEAPMVELVAKWFREENEIVIQPCAVDIDRYLLKILVNEWDSYEECYCLSNIENELIYYDSYEDALSAGIDKVIIKIKKDKDNGTET